MSCQRVLTGEIPGALESMLREICTGHGWEMISLEIQPDHIHLILSIPPADAVANAVKLLKGITARKLFVAFPELKKSLWGDSLWSPSYYVGTAGNVNAETIQRYIERTEHIKGRR
jgi:putative transposase